MKKKIIAMLLSAGMALSMWACAGGTPAAATGSTASGATSVAAAVVEHKAIPKDKIKVGFLYVGVIGDEGYSYQHDQGRLELEKELGVKTMYLENVPETSDCEKSIRDLIDQGCNVIYATSFGHMQWIDNVAKEYPDVYFGHATGYMTESNMSNYFGRIEQPRYLSGIVAGMASKNGKLGYVAAMPTAEVIRGINAFTLGVRSVNPKATVEVKWINSWYDPSLEKSAAVELLNSGCDVLAQHCDTTAPQVAAQEKGAFAVGYNASTLSAAPKAYLTAPLFHWGVFYVQDVKNIIAGTWKSQSYWEGMKSGMVSLDKLSANCPAGAQAKVDEMTKKIEDGSFDVFTGEIKDNTGAVRVKAGEKMSDADQLACNWFAEGVIGTIPKS